MTESRKPDYLIGIKMEEIDLEYGQNAETNHKRSSSDQKSSNQTRIRGNDADSEANSSYGEGSGDSEGSRDSEGRGDRGDSNYDPLLRRRPGSFEDQSCEENCHCCGPKCYLTFSILATLLFFLLWLGESQFGEGVLRLKYEGETCGVYLIRNKKCAPGFDCMAGTCQISERFQAHRDPIPAYDNFTLSQCPPCPAPRPCPPVRPYLVTYFDFNEKPNHWIDPGSHGYFQIAHDVSYGACKELCSISDKCKALNYLGPAEMCCLMDKPFYSSISRNDTWNAAVKIR